jgi:hypothetical protein
MTQTTALQIIAIAVAVIALIHIGVLIALFVAMRRAADTAARMEQRVGESIARFEQTAMPVIARIDGIAVQAGESLTMVRHQLSRWEATLAEKMNAVDRTVGKLQTGIYAPVRETSALVAGAMAVMRAFRRLPLHQNSEIDSRGD